MEHISRSLSLMLPVMEIAASSCAYYSQALCDAALASHKPVKKGPRWCLTLGNLRTCPSCMQCPHAA
jgi:hypothetical protein